MTHRKTALIALTLAACLPLVAFAGPGFGERGFGERGFGERGDRGHRILPPADYLDLTDEQIEAAEALREGARSDFDGLRAETEALRQQLETALESANPDPAQVGQMVIDLRAQKEQFGTLRQDIESQFAALLNDEQLAKWENFKELRESRRDRRADRRHGRFGQRSQERSDRF